MNRTYKRNTNIYHLFELYTLITLSMRPIAFHYTPPGAHEGVVVTPELAEAQLTFFKHIIDSTIPPMDLVHQIKNTPIRLPVIQKACR